MISPLEFEFDNLWEQLFPDIELVAEIQLIPGRKFRFDYVHLEGKVVIELNGGNWVYGRHCRPKSLATEYEKLNLIQSLDYAVFILNNEMITERWLSLIATTISQRMSRYRYLKSA
jgi:hypothetical protein